MDNRSIRKQFEVVRNTCSSSCIISNHSHLHGSTDYCSYCQQERKQIEGNNFFYEKTFEDNLANELFIIVAVKKHSIFECF